MRGHPGDAEGEASPDLDVLIHVNGMKINMLTKKSVENVLHQSHHRYGMDGRPPARGCIVPRQLNTGKEC